MFQHCFRDSLVIVMCCSVSIMFSMIILQCFRDVWGMFWVCLWECLVHCLRNVLRIRKDALAMFEWYFSSVLLILILFWQYLSVAFVHQILEFTVPARIPLGRRIGCTEQFTNGGWRCPKVCQVVARMHTKLTLIHPEIILKPHPSPTRMGSQMPKYNEAKRPTKFA